MIAKVVVFFALAVVAAQALPTRIVGGHDAEKGAFPYQVSVRWGISALMSHVCGGSILNERWIMTAGHCITEVPSIPFFKYYIAAGIHGLTEKGQMIKVKRSIVHPDYNGGVNPNDIALMELSEPLVLSDTVKAVTLPEKDALPSGESTLSGWGSTSTGWIPIMPKVLQTVDLPVLSHEECVNALVALAGSSEPLAETNVCTGPIDKAGLGACSGDSGGPLVTKGDSGAVQIGIVSWGMMPCGTLGAPSVYTRVSAFVDFINENIN